MSDEAPKAEAAVVTKAKALFAQAVAYVKSHPKEAVLAAVVAVFVLALVL